jgi:cytochrome c nitrite reductase small subunit
MKKMGKSIVIYTVVVLAAGCLLLFFLLLGPPRLLAKSDTPGFCVTCHVMESAYEAWFHSAHRRQQCVDCHLPNQNMPAHYFWKAIDGFKDMVVFYSGKVPERIVISPHGEKAVQANCIRCHETAVTMIDRERKCWECHRQMVHQLTGSRETL